MSKHDLSSRHFQRKISEFCELRIAPVASRHMLENIRPYLASLIVYRKSPPLLNGHIDWTTIGKACGIEAELTAEFKKRLRPSLDAIIRWLYGNRKLHDDLLDQGEMCCPNRVARLTRLAGIKAQIGYKRRPGIYGGRPRTSYCRLCSWRCGDANRKTRC